MLRGKQPAGTFLSFVLVVYCQIEETVREVSLVVAETEKEHRLIISSPPFPSKEKRKHCILDQRLIDTPPFSGSRCAGATARLHGCQPSCHRPRHNVSSTEFNCQVSDSNCRY